MKERVSVKDFKHQWVEDILYHEGPLLSLLKASTSQDFFYYWCGVFNKQNQWLAFEVTRDQIEGYKNGDATLLEIVKSHDHAYLVFIDVERKVRRVWQYSLGDLPKGVLPPTDSYFDADLRASHVDEFLEKPEKYAIKVDGDNWFIDDMVGVPRVYQQLYSFIYTIRHLRKPSVRANAAEIFQKYPWRGGFSRVNLFHDLRRAIPSMHEAKISSLAMASAGSFTFELEIESAQDVRATVETASGNLPALRELKRQVDVLLYDNHLKTIKSNSPDLRVSPEVLKMLRERMKTMAEYLGLGERLPEFRQLAGNDLVALKILVAFYLRVERFANFQASGMIKLG